MTQSTSLEQIGSALTRLPVFAALHPNERMTLAAKAYRKSFRADDIIFSKGDPGHTLHIIVSGMVKISLPSEDGGEALLAILLPGEFFGELSLFDGQPRSASAVTMTVTETVVLHRDEFLSFIKEHPSVVLPILSVLSNRLRGADDVISDCVFLDIPARVAKKLVELSETFGHSVDDGVEIDLRLRQQELASMVGTTRESVNRALSLLENKGAIKLDRQKITILQLKLLKETTSF